MVGCLAIVGYVILTIWIWVRFGLVYGIAAGVAGFIILNLVGPLIDRYIDTGGQAKAEEEYQSKLQTLMAQHAEPGGLPGDLAFLFACTTLPPQKTLLARFDRAGPAQRRYLREIRDIANRPPQWRLPIPAEATDDLQRDCLGRLHEYRQLSASRDDPYLQDWVERVILTYESWYDEDPPRQ